MASSDSTEAAALMSKALLTSIAAPIKSLEPRLSDFKKEQDELLKKMESENADLESLQRGFESTELLFSKVPEYLQKITLLHRDMIMLENKATDLKTRAEALKQHKMKQMEKDAQLQAKPSEGLSGKS